MVKTDSQIRFLVGVDEAGRGPLAGPVAVGAVVVSAGKRHPLLAGVKDSKMLTPRARREWFGKIRIARKNGTLGYSVSCVGPKIIDDKGIVFAVRLAVSRSLKKLGVPPHRTLVLLDGSLSAPKSFIFQKTIIRGDQTVPIISLASIPAKVVRDGKMIRLSKKYPDFGFEIHKGYGTRSHYKKIRKHGTCEIHRNSFLRSVRD